MPKTNKPIERRKKLLEDFKRAQGSNSFKKNEFEPIKHFTNIKAVKEFDKWYFSTMGGTDLEK